MDLRSIVLALTGATLACTGLFYGVRFMQRGNHLIGVEWLIMGISSTNATVFFLTQSPQAYDIAHFFDAFSRAFGLPIVTSAGLLVITHGYRPTAFQEILYFALSFAAAAVLVLSPALKPALPVFYLVMWLVFTMFLMMFALELLKHQIYLHFWLTVLAVIMSLAIAVIYDFFKIPGDETHPILNFYSIALMTWAFLTAEIYYAYFALERVKLSRKYSRIAAS